MQFLQQKKLWTHTIAILVATLLGVESFVIGVAAVHAEEVVTELEATVEQIEEVEDIKSTQTNEEEEEGLSEGNEESELVEEEEPEPTETVEPDQLNGEAEVETGEAVAVAEVTTGVNHNEVEEAVDTSSDSKTASSTDEEILKEEGTTDETQFDFVEPPEHEFLASTTNEVDIETTATVTAKTGDNQAVGETATIVTGNAVAVANIVNLANTNIINSSGFIGFFSALGLSYTDLSRMFTIFETTASASTLPCAENVCGGSDSLTVNNTNDATVENNVSVIANTGGNTAFSSDGAIIDTGDAYAAANIFNVINTNITDSNYLLLSFNNFGSYNGDIVLPNSSVFSELFEQTSGVAGPIVVNENEAVIENSLTVVAETGDNEAESGEIVTGDSFASGNVVNQVNQNLFGSDSFLMVLRVHGNWSGDIFGLPKGVTWEETERGIEIYSNPIGSGGGEINTTINNQNNANVMNNVSVYALTGENKASGEGRVETGDAYAGGNIVNLVNTNILGQNWATLVFDIFGDWNGNVTFGQPDLWVGARAETEASQILNGDFIDYTFTVANFGDVTAEKVSLRSLFSNHNLNFEDKPVLFDENLDAHFTEELGSIAPGETISIEARGKVDSLPDGQILIPLTVEVFSEQSESNMDNNRDTVNVLAGRARSGNSDPRNAFGAKMQVEKVASTEIISSVPEKVEYTITVENTGGKAYHAVLIDTFIDPEGTVIHEERWELGTIGRETIVLEYSLDFTDEMPGGTYRNEAQVVALDRHESIYHGNPYLSEIAVVEVTLDGPEGQVLGISTDCSAYLTEFMRFGSDNTEEEVSKLQSFLSEELDIEMAPSGIFDFVTHEAVRAFQNKYRDEVLLPWNMAYPSGYVYLTTRKKINEIHCRGARDFPLTRVETVEIERYRLVAKQTISKPQNIDPNADVIIENTKATIVARRKEMASEEEAELVENRPNITPKQLRPGTFWSLVGNLRSWLLFLNR